MCVSLEQKGKCPFDPRASLPDSPPLCACCSFAAGTSAGLVLMEDRDLGEPAVFWGPGAPSLLSPVLSPSVVIPWMRKETQVQRVQPLLSQSWAARPGERGAPAPVAVIRMPEIRSLSY